MTKTKKLTDESSLSNLKKRLKEEILDNEIKFKGNQGYFIREENIFFLIDKIFNEEIGKGLLDD